MGMNSLWAEKFLGESAPVESDCIKHLNLPGNGDGDRLRYRCKGVFRPL